MPRKIREYNLREEKDGGYGVSITHKGIRYMNAVFDDKEKAIRSADITILKHSLPFKTKRLKPKN